MLDQVASHAGFSLILSCEGDLDIDAHHSLEDCALAMGAALRQALGDKRGIGRFGFSLPMDETEAHVLIDLSGRAYSKFEGRFEATHIGAYPTEMTPHIFRSFADSMGAASTSASRARTTTTRSKPASKPSAAPCAPPSAAKAPTCPAPKVCCDRQSSTPLR
jgi:imidazoleglycerol phosphate dehydratase HisB